MAVEGLTREQIVYMVKLAEQAERYEEMVSFMERRVVGFDEELTVEERNLLSVACNKVIGSLLLDAGSSRMEQMMNVEGVQSEELYKSKLETETSRILKLLDSSSASLSSSSSSSKRCLMEISTAKNRIAQSLMEETETKLTREHCISLAKLAEKSKRYEDMATFMEKFAIIGSELTAEGRDLFYLAHENVIRSLLASWLILSSIEQKEESQNNEEHAWLVKQYRSRVVETEISELCSGILKLLDAHLVPSASTSESKVLYLKMKGDYHGYLSEFNVGTERKDAAEDSVLAYKAAKAKGIITVHDASSEDKSKGIITVHDASSEDKYKVGNPVNQFSRDKPTLLTSDMQTNKFSREILGLIVRKLCHCSDFINFGAVCKYLKFVALENMQELPLGQFPGIVVPGILPESETRRLFLWNHSSCCFEEVAALQIPHRYLCCGSAFGWVFLTDDDLNTRLSNPFSGAELKLPSLHALRHSVEDIGNSKYIVIKAIYSSNPSFSPLPFVLIILDSPRLAFCKPGDKKWTDLNSDGEVFFTDAIYHKGKFYTLRWDGEIVAYDIKCNGQADYSVCATTIAPPKPSDLYGVYQYLVEVKGVLVILSKEVEVVIETEHLDVERVLPADDEDVEPVLPADDEDDAENSDDSDESSSESSDDNSDPSDDETTESSSEQSDDDIDDDVMSHHQGVNRWEERITGFNMLKFDDVEQKWVKLKDLGEYSVFIGLNTSFSLCATNFPGCIPNQVYFGGSENFEMGIFQLSLKRESRHVVNYRNNGYGPVWIDHTLWSLKHL